MGNALDRNRRRGDHFAVEKSLCLKGAALRSRPTDRYAAAVATVVVDFDQRLTAALKALSRRHATSLFVTILTGWGAVLSRLSGQEALTVGAVAAGPPGVGPWAPLSGVYAETIWIDLSGEPSGAELLQQVKERALEGQEPHAPGPSPAFQALFAWRNDGDLSLDRKEWKGLNNFAAGVDLTLNLSETGDRIVGKLEYATALLGPETVERHVGYLRLLLEGLVADDARPVNQLPILSEAERHRLIIEWNATEADYPREKCVHQLFEAQAAKTPGAIAVACGDKRLTYAELNVRGNQLARHLLSLDVKPDERVAICLERSLEMVVALLGVLKAGCAYVPLDPDYPIERLAGMLEDSAPIAVLTHGHAKTTLAKVLRSTTQTPSTIDLDAEAASLAANDAADIAPVSIGLTSRSSRLHHLYLRIHRQAERGDDRARGGRQPALVDAEQIWAQPSGRLAPDGAF